MNLILLMSVVMAVFLLMVYMDYYFKSHCRECGTKMDRFYDQEEDAEVYQCPKCGRCYIIH